MTGRAVLGWAVAAVVLVAACSSDDDAAPAPEPTVTTSTLAVDRSGIALAGVPGETTSTLRTTGTARLVGTVAGPAGLVPGATVRIERLVGGETLRTDVLTGPDGRFELAGVPGGRYRIRAFLPPGLAQTTAELAFLADGMEHAFALAVEDQQGVVVRADVAPDAPIVDAPVNLTVVVAARTVDADGIVRARPVTGAEVELAGLGRWVLEDPTSAASARLDTGGRASWSLRCVAAGDPGLVLRVPAATAGPAPATPIVQAIALDLPACGAAAVPTTTTTSAP